MKLAKTVDLEFLENLYFRPQPTKESNISFLNTARRTKQICSCGQAFERYRYRCPNCGTTKEIRYSNRNKDTVPILLAVYYSVDNVTETSFDITRYDLVYTVCEKEERVVKEVKKHSFLHYKYGAEKLWLVMEDGSRTSDLTKMAKYQQRTETKCFYNELEKLQNCKALYEKTGFKEFLEALSKKHYGQKWVVEALFDYLKYYYNQQNRGIELLLKAGFEEVAIQKFEEGKELKCGTKLSDYIKLPKNLRKRLAFRDCGTREIEILEQLYCAGELNDSTIEWILELKENETLYLRLLEAILFLVQNGYTLKGLKQYTERTDLYQAISLDETIMLLFDYVNMAVQANLPYDKYPNSLKKAHDLMAREYRFVSNRIIEEKFAKTIEQNSHLAYTNGKYSIVLPQNTEDVVKEGKILKHCVASYIKSIAEGLTMVVFLRKNDDMKTPFYTVEVRDGRIVQVRGFANKLVEEDDVRNFIREWAKKKSLELSGRIY